MPLLALPGARHAEAVPGLQLGHVVLVAEVPDQVVIEVLLQVLGLVLEKAVLVALVPSRCPAGATRSPWSDAPPVGSLSPQCSRSRLHKMLRSTHSIR